MGVLDEFHDHDVNNYNTSKERLGDSFTLADDVAELYLALGGYIINSKAQGESRVTSAIFLMACRLELLRALHDSMAGHLTDTAQSIRRAVEFCGFGYLVSSDSSLAHTWLEAGRSTAEYNAYKKAFNLKDALPQSVPWMNRLYKHYDRCSKQAHPSALSLARRVGVEINTDRIDFDLRTHELSDENPDWIVVEFLRIIRVHVLIIDSFYRMFVDDLASDAREDFEQLTRMALAKYEFHREYWTPHIKAMLETENTGDEEVSTLADG